MINKQLFSVLITAVSILFLAGSLSVGSDSKTDKKQAGPQLKKNLPLMDQFQPEKIETATFGLG